MAAPAWRFATKLPFLAVAGLLLAFPAGVAANSNNPITQTGGMSATLPLLGTSLTVDVTLDGVGNIAGVSLDPNDLLSSTNSDKSVVRFSNADGSAKVTVKASGDRMAIKAKASLANLLGDGTWSANVFGTGKATVDYTIGKDGSGHPTVSIGSVSTPGGVNATKLDPKSKASGKGAWAFAGVRFAHDGFTKLLTISVGVAKNDGSARLAIVLSGRDRQKVTGTLDQLAGNRTWSAKLCDGTPVSVSYHVASDGTVVFDGATGAPFKEHDLKANGKSKDAPKSVKTHELVSGIVLRFTKSGVGFAAWLKNNGDGTYTLKAAGFSGYCGGKHGHGHHHWGIGHHGGWGQGDRRHGGQPPKPKP